MNFALSVTKLISVIILYKLCKKNILLAHYNFCSQIYLLQMNMLDAGDLIVYVVSHPQELSYTNKKLTVSDNNIYISHLT